jgi:hypothetical protein
LPATRRARRGGDLRSARALFGAASAVAESIGASLTERAEARGFYVLARAQVEGSENVQDEAAEALALARQAGPSEVMVALLQREILNDDPGGRRARAAYEDAMALAREPADPDLVIGALLAAAWQPWFRGDLEQQLAILTEAHGQIDASGSRRYLVSMERPAPIARDVAVDQSTQLPVLVKLLALPPNFISHSFQSLQRDEGMAEVKGDRVSRTGAA